MSTPIVGEPSATLMHVGAWLAKHPGGYHRRFWRHIVPAVWDEFTRLGLDPVGGVAMSAWETARGLFTGAVSPSMKNVCGLRVEPDLHQLLDYERAKHEEGTTLWWLLLRASHDVSATWGLAARKFSQHVAAYLPGIDDGGEAYPDFWSIHAQIEDDDGIVDPRYRLVRRLTDRRATTWAELGDLWATDGYGDTLERHMSDIAKAL